MPRAAILVLTQMPDRESAEALARVLVESRLAACVSVGATVGSLYHWRGQIEMAQEVPVVIKTCADAYAAVEATVTTRGLPLPQTDLDWIDRETRPDGTRAA